MKNKILISVNNLIDIEEYKKVGINTFLFALEDFCVGYENTFKVEEINNYPDAYVLVNRLLDCNSVDLLKELLPQLHIKGIVYEDIAVFNIVKEMNLDLELIYFQNHFGTNSRSINYWFSKGIDSIFVGNEITKEEIKYICDNVTKPVVVQVLGYNQAMYSRRLLLSNYNEKFNLVNRSKGILEEVSSKMKFRAVENKYGTVLYSEKVFNGLELMSLDNVKFFYINSTFMSREDIMRFITGEPVLDSNKGFLDKKTIFKLKEQR